MSSCCLRGGVLCVGESVVVRSKQLREEVGSWRRSDGGGRREEEERKTCTLPTKKMTTVQLGDSAQLQSMVCNATF